MYSLRMSFWIVPRSWRVSTPWRLATAIYMASRIDAGALMVIEVDTRSRGISRNRVSMSSSEEIDTPTLPTSPRAMGSSASYPICVGRSKATERPVRSEEHTSELQSRLHLVCRLLLVKNNNRGGRRGGPSCGDRSSAERCQPQHS